MVRGRFFLFSSNSPFPTLFFLSTYILTVHLLSFLVHNLSISAMSVFYQHCVDTLGWALDSTLLSKMQEENQVELTGIDTKLDKAKEDEDETAIMDEMVAKADMLFRIGHKNEALEVIKAALGEAHVSTGQKIDLELKAVRIALFFGDTELMKEHITLCGALVEEGGDWDRRNRLKVYNGTYHMLIRDFSAAAEDLISSIATFTSYEVMDYQTFIQRTVYLSLYHLPRSELKDKVINSPDVRQVIREKLDVKNFLESLYKCDYKTLNQELLTAYKTVW
jgi:26S proteasome regulatory subunit N7